MGFAIDLVRISNGLDISYEGEGGVEDEFLAYDERLRF